MNKKLLLIPVLVMSLTACGGASQNGKGELSKNALMIESMRTKTYRVTFKGTKTETYPRGYEAYNNTQDLSYTREYGHINDDSSKLRAARVITDDTTTTYYEANDGRMYIQNILEDNTVMDSYVSYLGSYYRFAKYYGSPFDYLADEDFNENNVLNSQKANFLFASYTGVEHPVKNASFTYNSNGLVSKIDFEFYTYPVGVTTAETVETIDTDMTGSITFDYDISPIQYLTPYTEKSAKYETVINNLGDNYTITSDSNGATTKFVTYVAGNNIFLHLDSSESSMIANDMYYVKKGSSYRTYVYTGKEWTRTDSSTIDDILPNLNKLSAYIIEDKSEKHLSIKNEAVAYGADNFLIPYMGVTEGTGLKADMYLKNDKIDYTTATFYYYTSNIVVKNIYSDYGTTTMPIWFEAPEA